MKTILSITTIAALAATGSLSAETAVSPTFGYVTETLQTGFNLIGIPLHRPAVATGIFTTVTSTTVSDSAASFTTALPAGSYILEVTSGPQNGAIQLFSTYTNTSITTTDDLQASGVVTGNTYKIRPATTINSIFGANNESGLQQSGSSANADIIWVPNSVGGYDRFYRNQGLVVGGNIIVAPSWQTVAGVEAGNTPLVFTDGMFIQRKGSATSLVLTGEVKSTVTRVPVLSGFNIVASGFPVGTTLDNSGLKDTLTSSGSSANADIVWIPSGPGTYDRYYYNQGLVVGGNVIVAPSWQTVAGVAAGSTPLKSAVFIQRKASATTVALTPSY